MGGAKKEIFSSGMGFAFLTAVEVLDGFSSEWCFFRRYNCKCFGHCFICLPGITMEGAADHKISFITIRPVQTQCFRELTCGTNAKVTMDKPIGFQLIYTPSIKAQKSLNGLI
jgi:hypothetical protein